MTLLKFHARGIKVTNDVGVEVHLIQAKNDGAKNFYKRDDFIEPPVDPLKIADGFGRMARKTVSSRSLAQSPRRHQGKSYSEGVFPSRHSADFHHLLPLNYAPQSKSIASPAPPPTTASPARSGRRCVGRVLRSKVPTPDWRTSWRVIVAFVGRLLMIALLPQENRPPQHDSDATHVPPVIATP
jgi:hypothetical protein